MSTNRQLAAILFADIQGYTALMQQDENAAIALREKFQKVLNHEVTNHNGRIIQFSGDGALCIFQSAIEAVRAAELIQLQMIAEPYVPLRIGIHTGDVIMEGDNVYGDGVNVASRIESFAVPGAVFVSGKVYDEIKNQKEIGTVPLGRFDLKNVVSPVEIFAVNNPGLHVPSKKNLTGKGQRSKGRSTLSTILLFILILISIPFITLIVVVIVGRISRTPVVSLHGQDESTTKTIAVLPFTNLSASKEDEYFSDGMCDEILTQLSKISSLNVVSRTSTLQYKDTKKSVMEIGAELGAHVLLEGSVQKANDKIRINVQLIDADNDKHLWAETYDRDFKDVFAVQTEIARQIAISLNTTLSEKEKSLFEEKPTENLQAYDLYLRANKYAQDFLFSSKLGRSDNAIRLYEQAIKLDPKFLEAYHALIALYTEISWRKPVINSDEYLVKAKEWVDKMLALNIDKPIVHLTLAIYKYEGARDYAGALAVLDITDQMTGNSKATNTIRAYVLRRMGRVDEALTLLLRQAEIFPRDPVIQTILTETYMMKRDFNDALQHANKTMELEPDQPGVYWQKAIVYSDLNGDLENAFATLRGAYAIVDSNELRDAYIRLKMLNGNYNEAIGLLSQYPDSIFLLSQSKVLPKDLLIAVMYRLKGERAQSKIYFQKAHNIALNLLQQYPGDFRLHATSGIAWAGLGGKEKALAEGNKAVSMMPLSKDAIIGISPLEDLALIQLMVGNQDAAIDILEQLQKMPFGWDTSNTIPLLKIHPYWTPLQDNPRFRKMIQ